MRPDNGQKLMACGGVARVMVVAPPPNRIAGPFQCKLNHDLQADELRGGRFRASDPHDELEQSVGRRGQVGERCQATNAQMCGQQGEQRCASQLLRRWCGDNGSTVFHVKRLKSGITAVRAEHGFAMTGRGLG